MWFALHHSDHSDHHNFDNFDHNNFDGRYVVCIAKGMKPHLVLNDEEKQQRFDDDGGLVGDDGQDVGDDDDCDIGAQV